MKPRLCAAGVQLREQFDDSFPDRSRASDGWLGDTKHAARKSDHNPDGAGWVRAIDITANLSGKNDTELMSYVADQIRVAAKKDKRIAYVIYNHKIASPRSLWRWRSYKGVNPHTKHCHVSFTKKGDLDRSFFNIPLLGGIHGQ